MSGLPERLIYQIRVKGELDPVWAEHFEGLSITYDAAGNTVLTGPIVDYTALHSILLKVRDLNLKLISVIQMEVDPKNATRLNS